MKQDSLHNLRLLNELLQVQQSLLLAWSKTTYLTLGYWTVAGSAVVDGMKQDSLPDLRSLNCCRFSSQYCWHATWPWAIELLQVQQSLLLACNMTLGHWMNCCRFSSHCCKYEIWPWVIEWTVAGLAVTVVGMKHDLWLLNELLQVQQSLLLAWNMTLGYWMNYYRFSSHYCWHETQPDVGMKHDLRLLNELLQVAKKLVNSKPSMAAVGNLSQIPYVDNLLL